MFIEMINNSCACVFRCNIQDIEESIASYYNSYNRIFTGALIPLKSALADGHYRNAHFRSASKIERSAVHLKEIILKVTKFNFFFYSDLASI